MSFTYSYPRPTVTVDCIVFQKRNDHYFVLLIRRGNEPFKGFWAIPGGFVEMDESLESAASRELAEETGLKGIALEQFHAFGDPLRDPRHRTISVAYVGFTDDNQLVKAGDDAAEVGWFGVNDLPPLAFDHPKILKMAFQRYLTPA